MSDQPNPNDPTVRPPADDVTPNDDDTNANDDDGSTDDAAEQARQELVELKSEVRSLKAKLAAAKKAPKAKETKDDGPTQRELELEAKLEKADRRVAESLAETIALSLNAVDAEAAVKLMDWDSVDDIGDRHDIMSALKELRKDKPYLFKNVNTGAGEGRGSSNRPRTMNDYIRAAAGRAPVD